MVGKVGKRGNVGKEEWEGGEGDEEELEGRGDGMEGVGVDVESIGFLRRGKIENVPIFFLESS